MNDHFFTRWLPATLTVLAYVFSGGANWKAVEVSTKVNASNQEKFEIRVDSRLTRIENKVDILIQRRQK